MWGGGGEGSGLKNVDNASYSSAVRRRVGDTCDGIMTVEPNHKTSLEIRVYNKNFKKNKLENHRIFETWLTDFPVLVVRSARVSFVDLNICDQSLARSEPWM